MKKQDIWIYEVERGEKIEKLLNLLHNLQKRSRYWEIWINESKICSVEKKREKKWKWKLGLTTTAMHNDTDPNLTK